MTDITRLDTSAFPAGHPDHSAAYGMDNSAWDALLQSRKHQLFANKTIAELSAAAMRNDVQQCLLTMINIFVNINI